MNDRLIGIVRVLTDNFVTLQGHLVCLCIFFTRFIQRCSERHIIHLQVIRRDGGTVEVLTAVVC
jgi:hypothetical protein